MQIKNKIKLFFLVATVGASGLSYGMNEDGGDKFVNAIKDLKSLKGVAGCFVPDLGDVKEVEGFVEVHFGDMSSEDLSKHVVMKAVENPEKFFEGIENGFSQKDIQISELSKKLLDNATTGYLEKYGLKSSKVVKYGVPFIGGLSGVVGYSYSNTPVDLVLPAIITVAAAYCLQKPFRFIEENIAGKKDVVEKQVLDEMNEINYSILWNNKLTHYKKKKLLREVGIIYLGVKQTWEWLLKSFDEKVGNESSDDENPDDENPDDENPDDDENILKIKNLKGLLQNILIKEFETEFLSDPAWVNELALEQQKVEINKYITNPGGFNFEDQHHIKLLTIAKQAEVQFEIINKKTLSEIDKEEKRVEKIKSLLPGFESSDDEVKEFLQTLQSDDAVEWSEYIEELLTEASLIKALGGKFEDIVVKVWNEADEKARSSLFEQCSNKDKPGNETFVVLPLNQKIGLARIILSEELPKLAFKKFNANEFQSVLQSVIDNKYNSSWWMTGARTAQFALLASIFGLTLFGSKKFMNWLGSEKYENMRKSVALCFNDKVHKPISGSFRFLANLTRPYTTRPLAPFVDVRYLNKK